MQTNANESAARPDIITVYEEQDPLWRQFTSGTSQEAFCTSWLALHCRAVPGINKGVVLLGSPEENRPFSPVAFWPDNKQNLRYLAEAAERALNQRRGVLIERQIANNGSSRTRYDVAYPLMVKGRLLGVVALDLEFRPQEALFDEMRRLRWGLAWLEILANRNEASKVAVPHEKLQSTVSLIATLAAEQSFHGAAIALATAMATRFGCDRVSIGFLRRGRVRVEALSHSADFSKQTNLIRAIGDAMDEAIDQQTSIVFPELPGKPLVLRAQAELSRQFGNASVCTIPFRGHKEIVGAVTLERGANQPFDAATVELCESVAAIAGPFLDVQRRDDQWLWKKVLTSTREQLSSLIGPRHMALKFGVVGAIILAAFLVTAEGDFRITAKTMIEPATRQAIVAAFDGYLRDAPVRAGDVIAKDQKVVSLDDRDLLLERNKSEGLLQQSLKQYYEALGTQNASQVQILTSQIAQARAQLALQNEQLSRAEVLAPFDGIIVTGDLSHSLGAPVQRGQMLFEIAPLDSYRIILQVDERDIGSVSVEQKGQLLLSGFVDTPVSFSVGRLTPVSTAAEGRNYFRVEAQLESANDRLRPGMEGVSKIYVGRRKLVWIWTHEVTDWIRLKVWDWLP